MNLGPVTKVDKRNKVKPKKMTMTSWQKIVASLPFFKFTTNLEQSGSRIPNTQSVKYFH